MESDDITIHGSHKLIQRMLDILMTMLDWDNKWKKKKKH